jgi:hypothetical protein
MEMARQEGFRLRLTIVDWVTQKCSAIELVCAFYRNPFHAELQTVKAQIPEEALGNTLSLWSFVLQSKNRQSRSFPKNLPLG